MNSVSMLAPASCGTVPPETRRWMTERRSRRRWRRRVAGWMRTKSPTAKSLVVTSDVRTGSTGPCGDRAVSRERWTLAIRTGSKPASSGVICSAKNELQPRAESSSCSAVSARVLNGASDEKGLSPSALQYRGGAFLQSSFVPQRVSGRSGRIIETRSASIQRAIGCAAEPRPDRGRRPRRHSCRYCGGSRSLRT